LAKLEKLELEASVSKFAGMRKSHSQYERTD